MSIHEIINVFANIDQHINEIFRVLGPYSYLVIFITIFSETGFVITSFLPGDSLVFILGSFSVQENLSILFTYGTLVGAAILGDCLNFHLGKFFGLRLFHEDSKFFKKKYLDSIHEFFEKYERSTFLFYRFIPGLKTFVPFFAGASAISYKHFFHYNAIGVFAWVAVYYFAGYFFGNIPFIKENTQFVILFVLLFSICFSVASFLRAFFKQKKNANN
ncbi:MAG: VTT domain-containing protein [Mycoplasmatales bacterium]